MNYPDGTPIQVGDLVWWDEGACVGFIQWIWDEARDGDYTWANTAGPPLFIANRHPYTPSHDAVSAGVLHDELCLAGEGVGLLNAAELDELRRAISLAKIHSHSGLGGSSYSVETRVENCQRVEWVFSVYEGDIRIESIIVSCEELLP
jgi:hypothetical protein